MQGLINQQQSNTVYLQIFDGTLCQKSKTEREGYDRVEVVSSKDKQTYVSYVKRYGGIEAYVDSIEWYTASLPDGTHIAGWKLYLDANGQNVSLQLPIDSIAASRFMKLAPNLNFDVPILIKVWKNTDDGKTVFWVSQNGVTTLQAFTRENPNGLPEPKQRASGKWDYQDQQDFLINVMNETIIPAVENAKLARGNGFYTEPVFATGPETKPDEDIPF